MRLKFRKNEDEPIKDALNEVEIEPGGSAEVYGIVFTNATQEKMILTAYKSKVVVLSKFEEVKREDE